MNPVLMLTLFTSFFNIKLNIAAEIRTKNFWLTPCEEDVDCSNFKNSTCDSGLCKCTNEFFVCEEIEPNDVLINKLGKKCEFSSDCNIEGAHCHNVRKMCECDLGRVSSTDQRNCLRISTGIGGNCTESVQCYQKVPSTGCRRNECVCRQGTYEKNGTCYQTVDLGGKCTTNEDCAGNFRSCSNSVCSCDDGYIASGSRCLHVAKAREDECEEAVQCTHTLGGGSHCLDKICQCKDLYHYKASANKCVKDLLLGDICANHSNCHQPGQEQSRLECLLGKCTCRSVYREINGYCISSASSRLFSKDTNLFIQIFISYLFAVFLM